MSLFLVTTTQIFKNYLVKLAKMEIQKLIVRHANQVSIGLIKAVLENAFAVQVFMMIHLMNCVLLAIILGFIFYNLKLN